MPKSISGDESDILRNLFSGASGTDAKRDGDYKGGQNDDTSSSDDCVIGTDLEDKPRKPFRFSGRSKPAFLCNICDKSFFTQIMLNKHTFLLHSTNDNPKKNEPQKRKKNLQPKIFVKKSKPNVTNNENTNAGKGKDFLNQN